VSWSWSFGDGYTDTVQNPSHTYEYSGTYTVTLTVVNSEGAADTFSEANYITVDNPVTVTETETTETTSTAVDNTITAGFSGTPVTGASPLDVIFTDTSTGSPSSWNWDFGDGSQSTLENPSHIYPVPGTYTVSLTVTGPGGTDVKSFVDYITVTGVSTPVTTQTTASIINNGYTGAIQTVATYPVISRQPTFVGTPMTPTGQPAEQELVYFIIIGIIAVIVVVTVVLYAGAGTGRSRDEQ
jgi:PKD repeat protein